VSQYRGVFDLANAISVLKKVATEENGTTRAPVATFMDARRHDRFVADDANLFRLRCNPIYINSTLAWALRVDKRVPSPDLDLLYTSVTYFGPDEGLCSVSDNEGTTLAAYWNPRNVARNKIVADMKGRWMTNTSIDPSRQYEFETAAMALFLRMSFLVLGGKCNQPQPQRGFLYSVTKPALCNVPDLAKGFVVPILGVLPLPDGSHAIVSMHPMVSIEHGDGRYHFRVFFNPTVLETRMASILSLLRMHIGRDTARLALGY